MTDNTQKAQSRPKPRPNYIAFGLILGAGVGAALGVAMDNLAVFLGCGAGVGVALGAALNAGRAKQSDYDGGDSR